MILQHIGLALLIGVVIAIWIVILVQCALFVYNKHRAVCAWCKQKMRDGIEPPSHGICDKCARAWNEGVDK